MCFKSFAIRLLQPIDVLLINKWRKIPPATAKTCYICGVHFSTQDRDRYTACWSIKTDREASNKTLINHIKITTIWWALWSISRHHDHHLYLITMKVKMKQQQRMSLAPTIANSDAWAMTITPACMFSSHELQIFRQKNDEKKKEKFLGKVHATERSQFLQFR